MKAELAGSAERSSVCNATCYIMMSIISGGLKRGLQITGLVLLSAELPVAAVAAESRRVYTGLASPCASVRLGLCWLSVAVWSWAGSTR